MRLLVTIVLLYSLSSTAQTERVTSVSNVGLNVTNFGTIGNAFRGYYDLTGNTSCEYPRNSGVEHLFEGGIWVGGLIDGTLTAVSTAAYDASSGYSPGGEGFEMTAEVGEEITERSTLYNSPYFSSAAVSHQDYVADFTDANIFIPGTAIQIQDHDNPMGLDIHFESYNWNYSFSDFYVILDYTIVNNSTSYVDSLYVALWTNTVVRNVNITPAGQGGSSFYNKGGNGFVDTLHMAYCYDAAGDPGFTESYVAQRFLGAEDETGFYHPDLSANFQTNYQSWIFNNSSDPIFFIPGTDNARYTKMTTGLNHSPCWTQDFSQNASCPAQNYQQILNAAGNRSDLVSVGPFDRLDPGDTLRIAYAVVLAKKNEDGNPNTDNNDVQKETLVEHAQWAQTAYNGEDVNFNGLLDAGEDKDNNGKITRYILPAPPDIPVTRVVAQDNFIDFYWSDNSEFSVDPISQIQDFAGYRLYASSVGTDVVEDLDLLESLNLVGQWDVAGDSVFFETGLDAIRLDQPITFEGDTTEYHYHFHLDGIQNGWQFNVGVTAFDIGNEEANLGSLESSLLGNHFRVFPGTQGQEGMQPFVYPDPYYMGASWEGASTFEEDRKLVFANLPLNCMIRVYTPSGDLIDVIEHHGNNEGQNAGNTGEDIRWYDTYSDTENTVIAGGEHAWDILTRNQQILARGLYVFSVEDLDTGNISKGTFTIIK